MDLKELLSSDIVFVWKDDEHFYVRIKSELMYDDSIYVGTKDGQVSWKAYTVFMIEDLENLVESTDEEFREAFN